MTDNIVKRLRICAAHELPVRRRVLNAAADHIEAQAARIVALEEAAKTGLKVVGATDARIAELEGALESILAHRYGDWCDIARAALGDTQ